MCHHLHHSRLSTLKSYDEDSIIFSDFRNSMKRQSDSQQISSENGLYLKGANLTDDTHEKESQIKERNGQAFKINILLSSHL